MTALLLVFFLMYLIINNVTKENSISQNKELSLSEARRIASETNAFFSEAKSTAYVLSKSFLAQRNYSSKSRQLVLNTLHEVLSKNNNFYAIFTMWEKNAFDSLDLEYGKKYGQKTGRFSASAYRVNDSIKYQNHNILISNTPAYLSDGSNDEFEDEYYTQPKTTEKLLITEPYLYSYTKSEKDAVVMSSVVYPIMQENNFLGVVGIDIDIKDFNNIVFRKEISSKMKSSIISAEGSIVANLDPTLIGVEIDSLTSLSFSEIQDSLKNVEYLVNQYFSKQLKSNITQYFLPIAMKGVNDPWLVMVEIPTNEIYTDSRKLSSIITSVSLLSLLLLILIIYLLSNNIIKPIELLLVYAQNLARGKLDLNIQISRNDELGKLTEALKFMAAELYNHTHNLEALVKEKTQSLENTNNELYNKNEIIHNQNQELQSTLQHLKDTQAQLLQSEKMASLGILISGVAHEINNPLNYIMGASIGLENYFEEYESLDKQTTDFLLESIKIGIDRTVGIIKGLNQFSRNSDTMDEDCDIHSIIENCILMLHNKMKHSGILTKNYTANTILVKGNISMLHQVFINVLNNALYAINDSGNIVLTTSKNKSNIEIEISDTGCGIEKENLPQITDPFFTTKPPGEGTGLGLSITYSIIKEHNGSMSFDSELGKGTKVTIVLPIKKIELKNKNDIR
jgi:signal transduction histidine kinase